MTGILDGKSPWSPAAAMASGAKPRWPSRGKVPVSRSRITKPAAAETVALINGNGGQAISLSGDVTVAAQVKHAGRHCRCVWAARLRLQQRRHRGHQVEASGQLTHEWSEKSFDRMIEVNLKGVWLCMKHEIPLMRAKAGGRSSILPLSPG